jgi:cytoskeleton protein RodZ
VPNATTAGIGETLRTAREAVGTSIEEAAWRTRIRPEYLRALEEERFDACGHPAFARGHLHSYARFLGLDAREIVRRYVGTYENAEPSSLTKLDAQVKEAKRPPKPNWLIAAIVAGVMLIGASLVGIVHGPGPRTGPEHDALPSLPASASSAAKPSAAPTVAAAAAQPVTLVVVTTARSWVQIVSDGKPLFAGTLAAGVSKTFTAASELDVTIGNAKAVRLILNGKDLGPPASSGSVYRAKLGPQGPLPSK